VKDWNWVDRRPAIKGPDPGISDIDVSLRSITRGGRLGWPLSGARPISIAMVLAVAYSISVNEVSKQPRVVRLEADNRYVAGQWRS
jgi:hypothetical protein